MSNVKDLIRFSKRKLGITNEERELKANEMELASKSSQRLNDAKIRKANAKFETKKNTILNKCEKEELDCKLTNLKCHNMMSISKNKSKEKIIKKDTSTWKKTIICLFLGTISSCLSVGGLILAADKTQMISIFIFSLIFTVAILLNSTVIQSKLFDMFRLEKALRNKFKICAYCIIIILLFTASVITNNISLTYLLKAFKFSNECKTIMSIAFSGLFDIVPFLINSTKLEYQMGQYDKSFLELFNDENNNENINQNNNQNNDEKTTILEVENNQKEEQPKTTQPTENTTFVSSEKTTILEVENNQKEEQPKTTQPTENTTFVSSEINNNFVGNIDKEIEQPKTTQPTENTTLDVKQKTTKKTPKRKSNDKAKNQKHFNALVEKNVEVGERVTASKLGLTNNTTYQNYRDNCDMIQKVDNKYIRVS